MADKVTGVLEAAVNDRGEMAVSISLTCIDKPRPYSAGFLRDPFALHPLDDWHDDHGAVLWWHLPVCEPPYRGPLLVHAAKKKDGEVRDFLNSTGVRETFWERHGITDLENELPFGAIIGIVNLIGCCRMDVMPEPSEREKMWGNWVPDRFAWERAANPVMFREPIPYRGEQGLFNVPDAVIPEEYRRYAIGERIATNR